MRNLETLNLTPLQAVCVAIVVSFLAAASIAQVTESPSVEARPVSAPRAQVSSPRDCGGSITRTLSSETIILCEGEGVDVEVIAEAGCGQCGGGLNVVVVQLDRAGAPDWMKTEALGLLEELSELADDDPTGAGVRVGVIHYSDRRLVVALPLTAELDRAIEPLSQPRVGYVSRAYAMNAAREALRMLQGGRRDVRSEALLPCEVIVFFASSNDIGGTGEEELVRAAQLIHSDSIPLLVGCPDTSSAGCDGAIGMPKTRRYYTKPPEEGKLREMMSDLIREIIDEVPLREMAVLQFIPSGLRYVSGSGSPEPTVMPADDGAVELSWRWSHLDAGAKQAVTYRVESTTIGAADIKGEMRFTTQDGADGIEVMTSARIATTGECAPATTTPTTELPTAEPTPEATDAVIYLPRASR